MYVRTLTSTLFFWWGFIVAVRRCVLVVCQAAGWWWMERLAYPVEGGGCDVELRVVVVVPMGATCLFQVGFVFELFNWLQDFNVLRVVGQQDGLSCTDQWSMMMMVGWRGSM